MGICRNSDDYFWCGEVTSSGGAVGKGLREFRKAQGDDADEVNSESADTLSKSNVSKQSVNNKKSKSKKSKNS